MNISTLPSGVFVCTGIKPGPTIAIIAGVHGDEKTGILALDSLFPSLQITSGTVFVIYANPRAIVRDVRFTEKNLNRCFYVNNDSSSYEDRRAQEIIPILDRCEAVLDLHAFNDQAGKPFIICEDNAIPIASKLDVSIISTNWSKTEPGGTDGYMYSRNKIGICLECGPISQAAEYKEFAIQSIKQFLRYFEMIDDQIRFSKKSKTIIKTKAVIIKRSQDFVLAENFSNFQQLKVDQLIGSQSGENYIANAGEYIIFPNSNAQIGSEAFTIGERLN